MNFVNIKNKSLLVFLIIYFAFFKSFLFAADSLDRSSAYANFIIGLVKNTDISKNGTICTFGSDVITKSILNQDSKFISLGARFNSSDLANCKAVYISESMQKSLRLEIEKFNKSKVFTIAIFDGFTESGGMVQVQLGRRNFELIVNQNNLKKAKVKFSALAASLVIN